MELTLRERTSGQIRVSSNLISKGVDVATAQDANRNATAGWRRECIELPWLLSSIPSGAARAPRNDRTMSPMNVYQFILEGPF